MNAIAWNKRYFDNALPHTKMTLRCNIVFSLSLFVFECAIIIRLLFTVMSLLPVPLVKQATRSVATTVNKFCFRSYV